jgi:hypothetical protein
VTDHRQVRCLDFECDEDLAELLTLMNHAGVPTIMSCQDNDGGRGSVRRVWVEIYPWDLTDFLAMLNDPAELDECESLSCRMAVEYEPSDGWESYREDRCWHYSIHVGRLDGEILADAVGIRLPYTDLPEVVARLYRFTAARTSA